MQWRILDDNVEIDLSYITCAEYQLFIDEKRQAGKNRQPDHWKDYRFPPGDAQKPITGVRASDAKKFCEWLTQQYSSLGFSYRLPTLTEAEKYPATEKLIGCWCNDRGEKVIAGIEDAQWQDWHRSLAEVVILKNNLSRFLNRKFYPVFTRNLYYNPYFYFYNNFKRNPDLYADLYRIFNRSPDIYPDLYSDFYRILNRLFKDYLYHNLYRDLKRVLDRVLDRNLNRELIDLNLYNDLFRDLRDLINPNLYNDLYRDLYRDINRLLYKRITADKASDFLICYFPLLFFIVIYQVLFVTYKALSQNEEMHKRIKLSRQKSEGISRKYLEKIDKIYPLYVYLVLLDERQAGRIPAWEGIRLVRERIE
ncbi:MAG: SUMF1/EgtB/PvdO family nonheme iron enzyme [Symploca sp. SIO2C1]|nr:SUMF1/EgtB/PvdO family nonheme iron enzyme [Symploca sp. SIO2C1]